MGRHEGALYDEDNEAYDDCGCDSLNLPPVLCESVVYAILADPWIECEEILCPVPLTVRGTQVLVGFAPLAPSVFCAARQNAVLRRSLLRPT